MEIRVASRCFGALMLLGCSDGSETAAPPPGGEFQARLTGARTAVLSGSSNAGSIYTEAAPAGLFAIRMFAGHGDTIRAIVIDCPGQDRPATGTYPVSAAAEQCGGGYSRVVSTPGAGTIILELASASSGSVKITRSSDGQVAGTFSFNGILVVGSDSVGTVAASGGFNAIVE